MSDSLALSIQIEVVYAFPTHVQRATVVVASNKATAGHVLSMVLDQRLITLDPSEAAIAPSDLSIGVFGQIVTANYKLQEGDRLEIYRPLQQDPKERRRRIARESQTR